jgi:hypothetical protein
MLHQLPEYIPILTFLFSIYFTKEIYAHYRYRKTKYLLWWTIGVVTFGLGTLTESINVVFGWSPANLKSWYIVGALLGGFPLAQGSVYLLMKKKFADTTAIILCTIIIIAAICVFLTPITLPENFDQKLTGRVFEWKWVRYFSPFINLYAFVFLVGGAVYSAMRYAKMENMRIRYKGNIFIAIGALLPGIGGGFTRMGYVNMLFVTELIGLLLIYYGYKIIKMDKKSIS